MFKKVYQFVFAFILLLTCFFFVSDKVFAATYSHEGNISIVKPSSDNVGLTLYNQYISVVNYYEENLKTTYPYYFFTYDVDNSQMLYYIFKYVSPSNSNSNFAITRAPGISYYLNNGGKYRILLDNSFYVWEQKSGTNNFDTYFTLSGCSFLSNKLNCTTDVIFDTNINVPFKSSRWTDLNGSTITVNNLIINNINYTNGLLVDLTPISSAIELDTKLNGINSNNLNSIDVYLDSTVENDGEYNFSLAIQDLYDYTNSNASYGDISGFSFKGLVNDNGLYHWETITDRNNFYVDYDDDDWTNNSSESCLNTDISSGSSSGGGHSSGGGVHEGCTGYSFKGTAYYDMTGYEQIKFSIDVYNTREYFIKYDDDYDSVSSDYIDLNYYFLGDETGQRYGRISSKGYRYMFFSAYGDLVNTELNNYYVIIRSNHYDFNPNVPSIYFYKYDTASYNYLDMDDNNTYVLHKLHDFTYLRYSFEINISEHTSFYSEVHSDDVFTYDMYIPDNLYFSYTNNVTNSVFVNNLGVIVNNGIFPNTDVGISSIEDYSNIFENAFHYFAEPLRFVFLYVNDFFTALPIAFKYTLISVFTLSIVMIIIKFVV